MTQLEHLSLHDNQLIALPEWLGGLTQLQVLDLSHNQLMALPKSLGRLSRLQDLRLSENRLTTLPEWIGQLTQLRRLDLFINQITALPESLGQLTELQILSLFHNQLVALPGSLGQLTRLQELHVGSNRLATLPDSLCQLTRLEVLELASNRLTALPDSLGQLTKLQRLYLSDNALTALPESLRELYLHGNKSLGIPSEVLGPTFQDASLRNYRGRPESAGPAKPFDILSYYFHSRGGSHPLNEAKLILVGRGGVGKTCLVNRLVYDRFDTGEKKTDGICITQWPVTLNATDKARLNIWDFGGQEIMHSTHQFFLTQRSVYLLVLNGPEGGEDADAEYWLQFPEGSCGGHLFENKKPPPNKTGRYTCFGRFQRRR